MVKQAQISSVQVWIRKKDPVERKDVLVCDHLLQFTNKISLKILINVMNI